MRAETEPGTALYRAIALNLDTTQGSLEIKYCNKKTQDKIFYSDALPFHTTLHVFSLFCPYSVYFFVCKSQGVKRKSPSIHYLVSRLP